MATPAQVGRCDECGRDLPAPAGRGRPRRFCGPTCRSAARRRRAQDTCELAVAGHACGRRATGEVRTTRPLARACAEHRPVAEALLRERYPDARWEPYPVVPAPTSGHGDQAGTYRLRFAEDDGWELSRAGEVIAGHDGYEADEVSAAQEWAAAELADAYGVRVTGWTTGDGGDPTERVADLTEAADRANPM